MAMLPDDILANVFESLDDIHDFIALSSVRDSDSISTSK